MKAALRVRERVAALAEAGTPAFEAVLSPTTWDRIKVEHAGPHAMLYRITGVDLFGVRVRTVAGARGVALRHEGGVEFDPENETAEKTWPPPTWFV